MLERRRQETVKLHDLSEDSLTDSFFITALMTWVNNTIMGHCIGLFHPPLNRLLGRFT